MSHVAWKELKVKYMLQPGNRTYASKFYRCQAPHGHFLFKIGGYRPIPRTTESTIYLINRTVTPHLVLLCLEYIDNYRDSK
jgi:hypothetical protein